MPTSRAALPLATREDAERRERANLSPLACYADVSAARAFDEPPDPFRTCFTRDRDRVVHAGAFRRLKDKTQVFVIDEGDFYRTRLTHTLEVGQLARFLCLSLRLNETLGEALALVHDIGHPPFGHEGERILDERAGVPFDHNLQAVRIVDVLESPYEDFEGLNLTHVLRRSILKHGGEVGRGAVSLPGLVLEAQAVDLADSIAYQHHDLEDALRAGILVEDELAELAVWRQALEEHAAARRDAPAAGSATARRKAVLGRLLKTTLRDVVEHSAASLTGSPARSAEQVAQLPGRLVRPSPERAARHAELGAFLLERFYRHPRVLRSAATAREAITVIVEHYGQRPDELPADYRGRIERDGLQRVVCDYVAGMTDRYAMDEWQRLVTLRSMVPAPESGPETEECLRRLERAIGYAFHDKRLAATALTHASARSDVQFPNERLEFLGDSVLGLCVAQEVYQRYPDRDEGELSRIKSAVVSRHALRKVAELWSLESMLTVGPGIATAGAMPASVVADAVEAVLGAVFLDGGLPPVRRLVTTDFAALIEASSDRQRSTNHKSELQNFAQGALGRTPYYQVLGEEGPDHAKMFTVAALVEGRVLAVASGRNKRQAEQRAAREALERLRADAGLTPTRDKAPAAETDDGGEA
jgi:dGTPase